MTQERMTRGQAIRAKCLDCCAGQTVEVRLCTASDCPLYRFRMGREALTQGNTHTDTPHTENNAVARDFEPQEAKLT